jgi:hypothetical protein
LSLAALSARAEAQDIESGAEVRANLRLGFDDCLSEAQSCPWLDFQDAAVFAPWVEARMSSRVRARGALEFRLHGPSALTELEDAHDPERLQPRSIRIPDAWISVRGAHADLKMGADRLAWGVADGFSLADRINPWDLIDPTRFDQRLSIPMGVVTMRHGSIQLEWVAAPFFQPAALPSEHIDLTASADDLFDAESTGAGEIEVGTLETRLTLPSEGTASSTVGSRLRWTGPWADIALSWTRGPDPIPQVDGALTLVGLQTNQDHVDVAIPMRFPMVHIGALEFRTELPADTSAWAEVTLTLPEETVAETNLWQLEALLDLGTISEIPDPLPATITQDGAAYIRWIGGIARHFGPVYLQGQWLRGFPTERQAADLDDYLLAAARWSIRPTVKLEIGGITDLEAWMTRAELAWIASDSAEFQLGAAWIDGAPSSSLTAFSAVSHIRSSVKVSF